MIIGVPSNQRQMEWFPNHWGFLNEKLIAHSCRVKIVLGRGSGNPNKVIIQL